MRAYLVTTGLIFALLAVAHLLRSIAEASRFSSDPWFILEGPGIGVIAVAFCVWAWTLWRRTARAS